MSERWTRLHEHYLVVYSYVKIKIRLNKKWMSEVGYLKCTKWTDLFNTKWARWILYLYVFSFIALQNHTSHLFFFIRMSLRIYTVLQFVDFFFKMSWILHLYPRIQITTKLSHYMTFSQLMLDIHLASQNLISIFNIDFFYCIFL